MSLVCIPMEVREMLPLRVGNREAGGNAVTSSLTSNLLESFVSRKLARRVRGRAVGKVLLTVTRWLPIPSPARNNFGIVARHTGLGGNFSVFLPHRAREAQHNRGVSTLPYITYFGQKSVSRILESGVFTSKHHKTSVVNFLDVAFHW